MSVFLPCAPRAVRDATRWPGGLLVGLALLALLAGWCAPVHAHVAVTCPPALVETPVVSSLLAGWDIDVRPGRRTLSDATIHVSRGSDRGGVAPDSIRPSGRQETATWTLSPGDGSVYWVACSYGNTSAQLLQKLPDTARHCVAVYDVLGSGRRLNVRPMQCD